MKQASVRLLPDNHSVEKWFGDELLGYFEGSLLKPKEIYEANALGSFKVQASMSNVWGDLSKEENRKYAISVIGNIAINALCNQPNTGLLNQVDFNWLETDTQKYLKFATCATIEHLIRNKNIWEKLQTDGVTTPGWSMSNNQTAWLTKSDVIGMKARNYLTRSGISKYKWSDRNLVFEEMSNGSVKIIGDYGCDAQYLIRAGVSLVPGIVSDKDNSVWITADQISLDADITQSKYVLIDKNTLIKYLDNINAGSFDFDADAIDEAQILDHYLNQGGLILTDEHGQPIVYNPEHNPLSDGALITLTGAGKVETYRYSTSSGLTKVGGTQQVHQSSGAGLPTFNPTSDNWTEYTDFFNAEANGKTQFVALHYDGTKEEPIICLTNGFYSLGDKTFTQYTNSGGKISAKTITLAEQDDVYLKTVLDAILAKKADQTYVDLQHKDLETLFYNLFAYLQGKQMTDTITMVANRDTLPVPFNTEFAGHTFKAGEEYIFKGKSYPDSQTIADAKEFSSVIPVKDGVTHVQGTEVDPDLPVIGDGLIKLVMWLDTAGNVHKGEAHETNGKNIWYTNNTWHIVEGHLFERNKNTGATIGGITGGVSAGSNLTALDIEHIAQAARIPIRRTIRGTGTNNVLTALGTAALKNGNEKERFTIDVTQTAMTAGIINGVQYGGSQQITYQNAFDALGKAEGPFIPSGAVAQTEQVLGMAYHFYSNNAGACWAHSYRVVVTHAGTGIENADLKFEIQADNTHVKVSTNGINCILQKYFAPVANGNFMKLPTEAQWVSVAGNEETIPLTDLIPAGKTIKDNLQSFTLWLDRDVATTQLDINLYEIDAYALPDEVQENNDKKFDDLEDGKVDVIKYTAEQVAQDNRITALENTAQVNWKADFNDGDYLRVATFPSKDDMAFSAHTIVDIAGGPSLDLDMNIKRVTAGGDIRYIIYYGLDEQFYQDRIQIFIRQTGGDTEVFLYFNGISGNIDWLNVTSPTDVTFDGVTIFAADTSIVAYPEDIPNGREFNFATPEGILTETTGYTRTQIDTEFVKSTILGQYMTKPQIESVTGSLNNLLTNSKTNLASAINELTGSVSAAITGTNYRGRFATEAARDAAVPNPQNGDMVFIEGPTLDTIQIHNGVNWQNVKLQEIIKHAFTYDLDSGGAVPTLNEGESAAIWETITAGGFMKTDMSNLVLPATFNDKVIGVDNAGKVVAKDPGSTTTTIPDGSIAETKLDAATQSKLNQVGQATRWNEYTTKQVANHLQEIMTALQTGKRAYIEYTNAGVIEIREIVAAGPARVDIRYENNSYLRYRNEYAHGLSLTYKLRIEV